MKINYKEKLVEVNYLNYKKAIKKLDKVSGIYIWIFNGTCMYVGATVNLGVRATRIYVHSYATSRAGKEIWRTRDSIGLEKVSMFIILCDRELLKSLEYALTIILKPKGCINFVPYSNYIYQK